jgi:hypothetical protein
MSDGGITYSGKQASQLVEQDTTSGWVEKVS